MMLGRFTQLNVSRTIGLSIRQNSTSAVAKAITPALLELKVGVIKQCEKHPEADKLYVSQIAISEDEDATPLTVCSGLVNFIPREDLVNRRVVLLTNLKPSKMRGIKSEAMVLASENADATKVEVVHPPVSSQIGELLHFKPFVPQVKPSRLKSKAWEELQSKLHANEEGHVVFKSSPDRTFKLTGLQQDDFAFVETLRNTIVR